MHSEEHNRSVQDKFDSRKFEVNQDNWNKLIPELEQLEKKKKRHAVLYFIIPGVLLLISFLLFLDDQTSIPLADNSSSVKKSDEKVITGEKENKITSEEKRNLNLTPNEINHQEKPVPSENDINNEPSHGNLSDEPPAKGNDNTITNDPANSIHNKGNLQSDIRKTKSKKGTETSDKPGNENNVAINSSEKSKEESTSLKPEVISENKPDSLTNLTEVVEMNKKDSIKPLVDSTAITAGKKDSVLLVSKDSLANKKDSLKKKEQSFEVFAAAYLAFTPGFTDPVNFKDAFNPSVGIGIRKFFTPKLGIGTGIHYSIYGNISGDPKTFQSSTQDFGYTNTFTEISQKRLHYLTLPLTFELRLNKNTFSIGAEFRYLITGSAQIRTYDETFGTVTETASKKEYGYVNGLSNYDIGAMIMYSRRLSKRISFSALVNAGFIDVKNNIYFNSSAFDRNRSLQLGLSYKLK